MSKASKFLGLCYNTDISVISESYERVLGEAMPNELTERQGDSYVDRMLFHAKRVLGTRAIYKEGVLIYVRARVNLKMDHWKALSRAVQNQPYDQKELQDALFKIGVIDKAEKIDSKLYNAKTMKDLGTAYSTL